MRKKRTGRRGASGSKQGSRRREKQSRGGKNLVARILAGDEKAVKEVRAASRGDFYRWLEKEFTERSLSVSALCAVTGRLAEYFIAEGEPGDAADLIERVFALVKATSLEGETPGDFELEFILLKALVRQGRMDGAVALYRRLFERADAVQCTRLLDFSREVSLPLERGMAPREHMSEEGETAPASAEPEDTWEWPGLPVRLRRLAEVLVAAGRPMAAREVQVALGRKMLPAGDGRFKLGEPPANICSYCKHHPRWGRWACLFIGRDRRKGLYWYKGPRR